MDSPPPSELRAELIRAQELLVAAGLAFGRHDNRPFLTATFQSERSAVEVVIQCHDPGPVMEIDAIFPFLVPTHRRMAAIEAVALANMAVRLGHFEYDATERRVFFRAFHAVADQPMSSAQLMLLLRTAVAVTDGLSQPFQDVCLRAADPGLPAAVLVSVIAAMAPGDS